jgi:hypothetical protein
VVARPYVRGVVLWLRGWGTGSEFFWPKGGLEPNRQRSPIDAAPTELDLILPRRSYKDFAPTELNQEVIPICAASAPDSTSLSLPGSTKPRFPVSLSEW